jgi:hypothetical protein
MRRGEFAATLPGGDYALSTSGLTWNVDRMTITGSVIRMIAGEGIKAVALRGLLAMAESDGTDAWETLRPGSYRLIKRCR